MRTDETGTPCPETLGEYYDLSRAIFGEGSRPVTFLEGKIAETSRDEIVVAEDSQMRFLLFTMAAEEASERHIKA